MKTSSGMKILMYSDTFGGATTTFIRNDLLELAKIGHVKYLATGRSSTGNFNYPDVEIVPFHSSPIRRKILWLLEKRGWYLSFKNKAFSVEINKILDEFKPEVIQCNFGYEALRLTDNLRGKNLDIPVVINFLGYDASFHLERASYVRKLKELSLRPNVFATCNTGFLKANLEKHGIRFQVNQVIHTGIRLDYFDRKGIYPDHSDYRFLQIATLSKRKGQEVTIRAFKKFLNQVDDPGRYKLILAGGAEDPQDELIRNLPEELGIAQRVEFKGWISIEESRQLLQEANCYVHHSRTVEGRTEGIPTIISEAMSMELPVISTLHAGIPELVEDGVNGFLVSENDVDSYALRMKEILSWGPQKQNREKVFNEFNILKRTQQILDLYQAILGKKA